MSDVAKLFGLIGGRILLEVIPPKMESDGGILLIEAMEAKTIDCVVVSLAPDFTFSDEVKVGERVVIKRNAGDKFRFDGKEYRIVKQPDLLLIYDGV